VNELRPKDGIAWLSSSLHQNVLTLIIIIIIIMNIFNVA